LPLGRRSGSDGRRRVFKDGAANAYATVGHPWVPDRFYDSSLPIHLGRIDHSRCILAVAEVAARRPCATAEC